MSIKYMNHVWETETDIDGTELLTMLAYADWANDVGESWHSKSSVGQRIRRSESTARSVTRKLEKAHKLVIVPQPGKPDLVVIVAPGVNGTYEELCQKYNVAPVELTPSRVTNRGKNSHHNPFEGVWGPRPLRGPRGVRGSRPPGVRGPRGVGSGGLDPNHQEPSLQPPPPPISKPAVAGGGGAGLLYQAYKDLMKTPPPRAVKVALDLLADEYGQQQAVDALKIAFDAGANNPVAYARGVLKRQAQEGSDNHQSGEEPAPPPFWADCERGCESGWHFEERGDTVHQVACECRIEYEKGKAK